MSPRRVPAGDEELRGVTEQVEQRLRERERPEHREVEPGQSKVTPCEEGVKVRQAASVPAATGRRAAAGGGPAGPRAA